MFAKLLQSMFAHKLHKAVQKGDLKRVQKLVAKGADVNEPGPNGASPLFFAANTGSVQVAKFLLSKGARVNLLTPGGGTALHSALLQRQTDLALFLIDNGADIRKSTVMGVTPLHMAALGGLTPVVGRLLREGADIHALTKEGQSAVYCALAGMTLLSSDDPACVRLLFASGADPRVGAATLDENMVGFSDDAKRVYGEELEKLGDGTTNSALRKFAVQASRAVDDRLRSPLLGPLTRSDDPDFDDWWYSEPVSFPFWDGLKIPVVYVFVPGDDSDFIEEADRAMTDFLKKTRDDKMAITPLLDENFRAVCEETGLGPDSEALMAELLGPEDRTLLWDHVSPPRTIQAHRRHRRDKDIYIHMGMDCDWEDEHGLQLVFRRGRKLTRIARQDGWLTDADAFALPDSEDELLSRFREKTAKK